MRRRTSHHVWRGALLTNGGTANYDVIAVNGDRSARLVLAIAGDTYDEVTAGGTVGTPTARAVDEAFVGCGWHIERIVGDITYRGWALPGVTSPGPGYTPEYTVRTGLIVLESDGAMGVPLVQLDDSNPSDIEANWMHLEQFHCAGADLAADPLYDSDANIQGLNDLFVTRHYDIRVGRRLNPHDLLVWQWLVIPGPYAVADAFTANGPLVTFEACVRLLISR